MEVQLLPASYAFPWKSAREHSVTGNSGAFYLTAQMQVRILLFSTFPFFETPVLQGFQKNMDSPKK
jgi:hypothetical protein